MAGGEFRRTGGRRQRWRARVIWASRVRGKAAAAVASRRVAQSLAGHPRLKTTRSPLLIPRAASASCLPLCHKSLRDLVHGVRAAAAACRGRHRSRLVAVPPPPGYSSELPQQGATKSSPLYESVTLEAIFECCQVTEIKEPCWLLKFRLICRSSCVEQTCRFLHCSE